MSSLDSLQDGLSNICLIVAPCFVYYQPPPLGPEFPYSSSGLAWGSPSSAHWDRGVHQLSRSHSAGVTLGSPIRAWTGCGRGREKSLGTTSLRLHLQKDYAPAYFVRESDISFSSLSNDIYGVPQVDTAISVWRFLCWYSLLLAVIKTGEFTFLN